MSTPRQAAIFDLDRTLIAGSSSVVLARHLDQAGLTGSLPAALMGGWNRAYEQWGDSWMTMGLARLAAPAARSWAVAKVATAAAAAAPELAASVLPFARQELEAQRRAGRLLVLATTTPEPLIAPFARLLGFDGVVATRWATENGNYLGANEGPCLYGAEKLRAVQRWAEEHNVVLAHSVAYSDSAFDEPLLAGVGSAVVINPDPHLAVLARLRGWPVRHFDVPPGVVKLAGYELQDWLRPYNRPELLPARFSFTGQEHIPAHGPAIVVFNHRSYFDATVINLLMARVRRSARFLAKKELTDAPILGPLTRALGAIRVERASGSDEPLAAAAACLAAGELICMAPQGTIPRGPAFFDPELVGRWGAARLAALSGAPVIPVGLWGTEAVWPRNARVPRLDLRRPKISVTVGPPVILARSGAKKAPDTDANTRTIMAAIVALLPEQARQPHMATEEELARTYPPGYLGDAASEHKRRPGRDTMAPTRCA